MNPKDSENALILDDLPGYPLHYARDRVLEHYGLDHQVAKLAEESLEVALACYDYLLGKDPEAAGLHEEIPDWKNVGGQVWNGLGLTEDELREREQSKMDRQIHRIADGAGPEMPNQGTINSCAYAVKLALGCLGKMGGKR